MSFNVELFKRINGLAGSSHLLDKIMILFAKYGAFIVPLYLLYLWFKRSRDEEDKSASLLVLTSAVLGLAAAWVISKVYHHPRPFMIGLGKQLILHKANWSFPSDHATLLSAVAISLFLLGDIGAGIGFLVLDFIVGFSRVYCGIHFPYDIAGGFVVGAVAAGIVWAAREVLFPAFEWVIVTWLRFVDKRG